MNQLGIIALLDSQGTHLSIFSLSAYEVGSSGQTAEYIT